MVNISLKYKQKCHRINIICHPMALHNIHCRKRDCNYFWLIYAKDTYFDPLLTHIYTIN